MQDLYLDLHHGQGALGSVGKMDMPLQEKATGRVILGNVGEADMSLHETATGILSTTICREPKEAIHLVCMGGNLKN